MCTKWGLRKRYDKAAMLRIGGDRPFGLLLDDIARRSRCKRIADPGINGWDKCGIVYPDLPALLRAQGKL